MRYMKVKIFIITVLILISGIVLTSSLRVSAEQEEQQLSAAEQKLLQVAATREGIDASQLQLLKSSTVELPLTGRRVQTAKVLNPVDGRSFTASIDEQEQEVDFSSLQAEEQRAFRARYGKLHPKLQQKIAGFGDEQSIKDPRIHRVAVAFWLNPAEDLETQDPRDARTDLSREEVNELLARRMDQVKAATSRATEGLTRALERAGHVVDGRGEDAPVVFATLPADLVKQFAERADVEVAYLAQDEEYKDHMNVAGPSIKADALWNLGINGSGSRIAIIEDSRVDFNNSWGLDGCGYDGSVNVWGRHADYIVRYVWDTVTASAGNNGLCTSKGYVNSVGAGFNTIAVGNYNDSGTVESSDNVMSPTSSWEDPLSPHGDREKPEVTAPGTNIKTTIMSPNFDCNMDEIGSGTSFSAPAVAGLAADLMQAHTSLKVYPESVKALILAGATDNVEGAPGLSEKDGAGGVNALTSYTSVVNNRYTWRYVTPSSFDANRDITINMGWVNAGQRVKVALVWDSTPTSDYLTDPLKADLDLYVYGPNQTQYSVSWDNSYEVVDFTAAASGNFQIKVKNFRFDGVNEYVGVAWSLL